MAFLDLLVYHDMDAKDDDTFRVGDAAVPIFGDEFARLYVVAA